MNVTVNFNYGKPPIVTIYNEYGSQFMKSELKVKIPKRPHYEPDSECSCTEASYLKWKDKTLDKINQAVLKSLPKELYGTLNIKINIGEHHGL